MQNYYQNDSCQIRIVIAVAIALSCNSQQTALKTGLLLILSAHQEKFHASTHQFFNLSLDYFLIQVYNFIRGSSPFPFETLIRTFSHKTVEEMTDWFRFNEDQWKQKTELLAGENNYLWSQVLYGITEGMVRSSRVHSFRCRTSVASHMRYSCVIFIYFIV